MPKPPDTTDVPSSALAKAPSPALLKPGDVTEVPANSTPTLTPASVVTLVNQALCESPDRVTKRLPVAWMV